MADYDALVVGTGFAGLYELLLLKQLNLNVKAVDSAGDVGGTWFWNRYPGARSDVESYVYRYSWDKESLQSHEWANNYLSQPELLAYFQDIARKHDLYKHIQFNTSLEAATWKDGRWSVKLSTGEQYRVKYLVTAIGLTHKAFVPDLPGKDTFRGQIIHSSAWDNIDYENKRIAVIGSGASGVQLTSSLAPKAKTLTQFIRHAQYVLPAAKRPVPLEERGLINHRYNKIWNQVFTSATGFGFAEPGRTAFSVSPEDRETIFQDLWDDGSGFRFLFGGFSDLAINEAANKEAVNFIHRKIKEIVKDPAKAEVLTSSDWFARRPLTDDEYYYRFNQNNVFAVDTKKSPIEAITPEGIKTANGVHEVDLIVFATGFDVIDGSFNAIDIRGKNGLSLKEHWKNAPKAHLGVATSEFPNLLFVNGPGVPFANISPVAEVSARLVADLISHAEQQGTVIESSDVADEAWLKQAVDIGQATLFTRTPSWIFGENIPGKAIAPRLHFGGLAKYRSAIAASKANSFEGFQFERTAEVRVQG